VPILISDEEKVARFRAFWTRAETDRPLIGTTIATFPSMRAVRRAAGLVEPGDLDVQDNLKELDEEWEDRREVMGDAMFVANPLWAFPWHSAMAGCPIKRDADNLWALPALDDWGQLERLRFDPGNPWFRRQLEFTQALVRHAAGRYPVGAGELMLGPVDLTMTLRGHEQLALDMYDAPEMVDALGQRCVELCAGAARALYAAVPTHLGGRAGTIRYLWAPGEVVETAEDISFMMSPALHRRFVAPLHRAMAQRFPYTLVHLHSAQLHTVPSLLDIEEVAAIQITPDFGEDLVPQIPLMAQILERKPLLIHGVMRVDSARTMMRQLPRRGLALLVRCDTRAEAAAVLDSLLEPGLFTKRP
jgi:hypothetical protein